VTGRQGRRRKLLDDLQERRGYSHLKEKALDRTMWRARFGWCFGPVVRQTTKWSKFFHLTVALKEHDNVSYLPLQRLNSGQLPLYHKHLFHPLVTVINWTLRQTLLLNSSTYLPDYTT
jgi:hypothetical protein